MNLVLFYSLSPLILISLTSAYGSPFYEEAESNCAPANCGNVKNITFPFWVENQQRSYCGFPSFKLSCKNQTLILANSTHLLEVKNIFYENRSVLVVDERYADLTFTCEFSRWSPIYFDPTPFISSRANKRLVFLYNCSKPPPTYGKISCNSSANSTYAVWDTDRRYPEMCSNASTLVAGYMGGNVSDYLRAVKYGFLLDWSATHCGECKSSHGQCGYNESYTDFMCICPDRNHSKSCPSDNLPVNPFIPGKKINSRAVIGLIIGVVAGIGGVLLVSCLVLFLCIRRKRKLKANPSNLLSRTASSVLFFKMDPEAAETCYNTHIFSYDELEEATQGFHKSRELGHGGFGTVYKGKLQDGRTVAVKRLHERNCRLEQFTNEVEILSRLRHQNLVTLYGCTSRHCRELLLVYEYIPNGTLADHLHGPLTSKLGLPWPTRMSIIIQTAEALSYLHSTEPPIIHRDIKTNNILVDNNFQVKVADFGISRLFPLDASHISTGPQGTFGYLDPEYYLRFQLTDKSDVYSFGVVMIELISSKLPVDIRRNSDEISLAIMAITKIRSCMIGELVDPDLEYEDDLEVREMIDQVAQLAFRCLQSDAEMRPSLREVLGVLKRIKGEVDADGLGCDQVNGESTMLSYVNMLKCFPLIM